MKRSQVLIHSAVLGSLVLAAACGGDNEPDASDASAVEATDEDSTEVTTPSTEPTAATTEPIESTAPPTTAPPATTPATTAPATTAPPTTEPEPACPDPVTNDATQPAGLVAGLDLATDEATEGVAVDWSGNVFVTLVAKGELLRFAPGSGEYEVFGAIPDWEFAGTGFLGLAADVAGNVYGAVHSGESTGVWKFDCGTGEATKIAGSEQIAIPNALAFDSDGYLYVTDFFSNDDADAPLGAIWRISPDGDVEKWVESETLGGTGAFGLFTPAGANGIAFRDGALYVAVTEKMAVYAIPVLDDGTAGEITPLVEGGIIPDGIALDNEGRIYLADVGGSAVKRVSLDGTIEVLAEGAPAGLDLPASLAFGTGGTELTLYVTNLANIEAFSTGIGPGLVAVDVATPGYTPWP